MMATLAGNPTHGRSHLKLVHSRDDARAMNTASLDALRALDDPSPGPRDASLLVSRFAVVLPEDTDYDGIFSLGESG